MATVGDVLREVLPSGTMCLAGQVALSRPAIRAEALRLRGGFADLGPGTQVLINLELLRQLPARLSLSQAIDALGRAGVAAIAVRGRFDQNELPIATRLAQRWSCVLLQLPDSKEGGSFARGGEGHNLSDERARCRRGLDGRRASRRGTCYLRCRSLQRGSFLTRPVDCDGRGVARS